ncbi:insulin-like growth factor-binding protein 7 isoform X1 [Numida meleagris]|uniref:insulin-like growth factor-binding protein 7 isoform X1 n=1 Tax=Numida meleagris TaxID=8996 RepID=UPI000B3DAFDE|nr:insulin-like growth factor-binding protein 7 isoform X1 [Numida meleagris]XP_021252879.1 insulin-like growth factor-binding protein 7 isoform X1 [Numida meleagris]XP_021252880.1 insulin-like growth factor-binding protein 7 isoform X1 [Numida meleagris]
MAPGGQGGVGAGRAVRRIGRLRGRGFSRRGLSGRGAAGSRAIMPSPALWALALLTPAVAAVTELGGCGPCDAARCPALPPRGCPLGRVRDACGCCWQCGRGEGEACGGAGVGGGRCAAGLECVKSRKRRKAKGGPGPAAASGPAAPVGVCVCKSRYPVCGSDGLTYGSGCQLRAASLRAQSRGEPAISQRSKGACEQGPSIVTPPKDIWNVTGAQIYLSCEVIGIPTPVLIWNKIIQGQYGIQRMELLPGDRENLAIQTRGGPEKHEVTGWVLISPLSKEDAGEYECHASNAKGEATASAKIHVVETLHEIALTKDDGAEL